MLGVSKSPTSMQRRIRHCLYSVDYRYRDPKTVSNGEQVNALERGGTNREHDIIEKKDFIKSIPFCSHLIQWLQSQISLLG